MFAFHGTAEQKTSCSTTAKFCRRENEVPIAQVNAIQQYASTLDVIKTHQQIRDGGLAGSGMADKRD